MVDLIGLFDIKLQYINGKQGYYLLLLLILVVFIIGLFLLKIYVIIVFKEWVNEQELDIIICYEMVYVEVCDFMYKVVFVIFVVFFFVIVMCEFIK